MTKKEDKHALYLVNPETGDIELIHGDDVEAKQSSGWKQPEGQRANGYAYNREEDLAANDAAAEEQKINQAAADKREADAAKADAKK